MASYVPRALNIRALLGAGTVFLFGPRQTGKSSYLRNELADQVDYTWNLLDQGLFRRASADPTLLRQELAARNWRDRIVCIDEIQRCPDLLNEVHLMIEERDLRFLLTGSSARGLRRRGVNLLGGRGRDRRFHPLTWFEITSAGLTFDLDRAMNHGLLPPHWFSVSVDDDLDAYVGRYLTEEIGAEGSARNLPAFNRFLEVAALANAQEVNFTAIGSDAGVARQTVVQWFQVLTDTLAGAFLPSFTRTVKRKAIERAKFFLFDPGIVRALRGFPRISAGSADFGPFFEHLIYLEILAWRDYRNPRTSLSYWRCRSGYEVDFVLGNHAAVEVKATARVNDRDLRGLRALREEGLLDRFILVCREERARQLDGIDILPWEAFFQQLWDGAIVPGAT